MQRREESGRHACVIALALALFAPQPSVGAIVEEIVQLPVAVTNIDGNSVRHSITLTIVRDDQRTSSPLLVINHGRAGTAEARARYGRARYAENARYFVARGYAVFMPTRVGYGVTGGPDVENSGPCARRNFGPGLAAAAVQTQRVIDYARSLPYVAANGGVLIGQSYGGAATVASSARQIEGIVAAVNFSGGAGGDPETHPAEPCSEPALRKLYGQYGASARIPTLWLYSENDLYWGKDYPRAWADAYRSAGGKAEFVQLPAHGKDGHGSFTSNPAGWRPHVERFLRAAGSTPGAQPH